jgi:hypothetical protein
MNAAARHCGVMDRLFLALVALACLAVAATPLPARNAGAAHTVQQSR